MILDEGMSIEVLCMGRNCLLLLVYKKSNTQCICLMLIGLSFLMEKAIWKYRANRKEGITIQLRTTTSLPHLFLKGVSIIPYHDPMAQKLRNITELANTPLASIVALDEKAKAKGQMIVDNDITDITIIKESYRHYKLCKS